MAALLPVYSGPLQGRFRSLGSAGFEADARVIVLRTGKESLIERFAVLMAAIRDEPFPSHLLARAWPRRQARCVRTG